MSGERIEKKKTTQEIKQKEMEEAMQCLGLSVVNTTIIGMFFIFFTINNQYP